MAPWYAEGTVLIQDPDLRVEASIFYVNSAKTAYCSQKRKVGKKEGKAKQSKEQKIALKSQAACGKYCPQQQQTVVSTKDLKIMPHTQKF
jgi:hypothetical protein